MCTVTFIARKHGYALGMNRDEKLTRIQGLPPARHQIRQRSALFPSEPGGGTWMGVNDAGVTFALINWYAVPSRVLGKPVSRGAVVREMLAWPTPTITRLSFAAFPLAQTNPFRLIAIFPCQRGVYEWRWDLSRLRQLRHPWRSNIWISSGFDEPGAQHTRRAAFDETVRISGLERANDLHRLHSSHHSGPGPYSVCMHRPDAATVSYTEVVVNASQARMLHYSGPPCRSHSPTLGLLPVTLCQPTSVASR
jgi:hypothetical protein